jgi:hypothetical protein
MRQQSKSAGTFATWDVPIPTTTLFKGDFLRTMDIRLLLDRKLCQTATHLKPHCIQSSRVLVPAGTSKSMLRRHGIQAVTRVMAYIANAVTL